MACRKVIRNPIHNVIICSNLRLFQQLVFVEIYTLILILPHFIFYLVASIRYVVSWKSIVIVKFQDLAMLI
jgi:hypothetical protein